MQFEKLIQVSRDLSQRLSTWETLTLIQAIIVILKIWWVGSWIFENTKANFWPDIIMEFVLSLCK